MATVFVMNPAYPAQIKVDPGVGAMMMEVGAEALAFAQDHAPVETGALKASLTLEHVSGNVARVSVNVDYWLFPEYGTVNMPAEPYLRPALAATGAHLT